MNEKAIFSNEVLPEFSATLKKRVNDYFLMNHISKNANLAAVFKSLLMFFLYLTPYFIIVAGLVQSWYWFLALQVVMGLGMAGIGMNLMHDAIHNAYSKRNKLNHILGMSLYVIGGNVYNWQVQHNTLHHFHTNIYGLDEDIDNKLILRLAFQGKLRSFHRFQMFFAFFIYSLMTLSFVFFDFPQLIRFRNKGLVPRNKAEFFKQMLILVSAKVIYFAYMLVIPILYSGISWPLIILGFIIMHLSSGLILSLIFQMAHQTEKDVQPYIEKDKKLTHSFYTHQLFVTSDFSQGNKVLSYLIGGLNFQIEHHLFPKISHIHYAKIAPIVRKTALEFNLPYHYNKTLLQALRSHLKKIKNLGRSNEFRIADDSYYKSFGHSIGSR